MRRYATSVLCGIFVLALIIFTHYTRQRDAAKTTQQQQHKQHNTLWPPNPLTELPPAGSSVLHVYEQAAICSDSTQCSIIGRQILEREGSAVDSAIATLLCNGLLAMQSMGLGGGMLMNVYIKREQRAYSILSRERAPLQLHLEDFKNFRNSNELQQSSLSIAVPGEVLGYATAHERFGRLSWHELVNPTLQLCRVGYQLTKHQRDALQMNRLMILRDTHLRAMFVDAQTKDFRRVGAHIQPVAELCRTLEVLSVYGPRSFYNNSLSELLLKDLEELGSPITAHDLRNVQAQLVESISLPLDKNYVLHLTPAPGSGQVLGLIMNILRQYREQFMQSETLGALEMHRIVEALKFGFVKRWQLDVTEDRQLLDMLACPEYAQQLAESINDTYAHKQIKYYGAQDDENGKLESRTEYGTAHISVLASNGDAVSVTSSINYYFGSGRMGKRTGILFNNAMSDFSFAHLPNYFDLPYVPQKNRLRAHASPMSSMAPTIVTTRSGINGNGDVRLVVGAAGGSKIISVLTQILVRTLWQQKNVKEAIDAARFHHQLLPNKLEYEFGVLQQYIEALEVRGHFTQRYRERGSAVCAVERNENNGAIFANADYRKEGGAAGF